MKIRMRNEGKYARLDIQVDVFETPHLLVSRDQRAAIFGAIDTLMTLVESAELNRVPVSQLTAEEADRLNTDRSGQRPGGVLHMEADTTVSGYYAAGADPQDTCNCYATDYRDCQQNGCFAIDGDRDFVYRINSGEYNDLAERQAEHEDLQGYDPIDAVIGFERLVAT